MKSYLWPAICFHFYSFIWFMYKNHGLVNSVTNTTDWVKAEVYLHPPFCRRLTTTMISDELKWFLKNNTDTSFYVKLVTKSQSCLQPCLHVAYLSETYTDQSLILQMAKYTFFIQFLEREEYLHTNSYIYREYNILFTINLISYL